LTSIEGVHITPLKEIIDSRGSVLHMLRADSLDFVKFGECYFSEVFPGATKAWKKHKIQTQNLAVPIGKVKLVIFDDRIFSKTYGKLIVLTLGRPESYFRVSIPPLVWYGFSCISPTNALIVNCSDYPHDPLENELKNLNDTYIPYNWEK
jgi:dTDP-4-dehydrorhamnose 3,5-epimerase